MARDRATRPGATPIRLFIAVDVPDAVKEGLAAAVAPHHDRIPGARWTRSDSWHVTLKFLGSTWPRLLEEVTTAVRVAAAEGQPFQTALNQIGAFPGPGRARVLWAGLEDPEERFPPIVHRLDELLGDYFVPESRAFTPHLTLARLNPARNLRELAGDLVGMAVASDPFSIDRLVLYRSHLSRKGARYELLAEHRLGDDAAIG